jgi:L-gulono-1,4-lactone dehydrogenase
VSQYTLGVVPSFHLHVTNQPMKLDRVLGELDDHVENNDHFEFFWVPHTKWALTKSNNRTTDPLKPRTRRQELLNDYVFENAAFGVACRVGKLRPSLIPRLATAVPSSGKVSFVDKSYRVFVSPRLVKFVEMEYSIPFEACAEALNRIRDFIEREGLLISFPVEVRVTSGDNLGLSTASGAGRRCYIAVHVYKGTDETGYFKGVESIMNDYGGRPHWGKMHYQTADTLAGRYEHWDDVQRLRDRLDPNRVFANAYTNRVFGA